MAFGGPTARGNLRRPQQRARPMAEACRPFFVLVCVLCEASFCARKGDLPEQCPGCRNAAHWRVALPGELTRRDRAFLKSIHVKAA